MSRKHRRESKKRISVSRKNFHDSPRVHQLRVVRQRLPGWHNAQRRKPITRGSSYRLICASYTARGSSRIHSSHKSGSRVEEGLEGFGIQRLVLRANPGRYHITPNPKLSTPNLQTLNPEGSWGSGSRVWVVGWRSVHSQCDVSDSTSLRAQT